MKIFKYRLDFNGNTACKIGLPVNAQFLDLKQIDGDYFIWCLVDPDFPTTVDEFRFVFYGTGWGIDESSLKGMQYLRTIQSDLLIWHFFCEDKLRIMW